MVEETVNEAIAFIERPDVVLDGLRDQMKRMFYNLWLGSFRFIRAFRDRRDPIDYEKCLWSPHFHAHNFLQHTPVARVLLCDHMSGVSDPSAWHMPLLILFDSEILRRGPSGMS